MKRITVIWLCVLLISSSAFLIFEIPAASPEAIEFKAIPKATDSVHNIDSGENFDTIQEAIDDSDTLNGHTIQVDAGIYYEHVFVDKSISLIGEDRNTTVIDGYGSFNTIYVMLKGKGK